MTASLEQRLLRRIAAEGPLTIADFMAAALLDPQDGYYTRAAPLGDEAGRGGDFVTAPEVSQVFGELLGLWCLEAWQRLGSPKQFRLIELGPGRGTLMSDLLRSLALMPDCLAAASIHLVEVSPRLRAIQKQTLSAQKVAWHESLDDLPAGPAIVLANEFFDALPLRQFERSPQGWHERLVVRGKEGLAFALSGPLPDVLLPKTAEVGAVYEMSPAATTIAAALARHLVQEGGVSLLIDYGYQCWPGMGSLQAVSGHRKVPLLDDPGKVDLSAQVDFAALASAAQGNGAAVHGAVMQGEFLRALGLEERKKALAEGQPPKVAARIEAACARLVEPDAMGEGFLVLALQSPDLASPPGFPDGL